VFFLLVLGLAIGNIRKCEKKHCVNPIKCPSFLDKFKRWKEMKESGKTGAAHELMKKMIGMVCDRRALKVCCLEDTINTGSLMAIGGWNGKRLSTAQVLNTTCDYPLPEGRFGHISVTTADGKTLVCGGWTPSGHTASCLQFHLQSKTWERHSSMRSKNRHNAVAIVKPNGVYVLGGTEDARNSSEFLATGSTVWTQGPDIPGPGVEDACGVKLSNTEFVILGGYTGYGHGYTQVLHYSETKDVWTEWHKLNESVFGQSCLRLKDKILMAGGIISNSFTGRTFIYDIKTRSAREVASLQYPRVGADMVLYGGKPLILGGRDGTGKAGNGYRSDGETWNMDTETWEEADLSFNIAKSRYSFVTTTEEIKCD